MTTVSVYKPLYWDCFYAMKCRYFGDVRSDCDSEQVHGRVHSRHHEKKNEVARVAVDLHAMLFKNNKQYVQILLEHFQDERKGTTPGC